MYLGILWTFIDPIMFVLVLSFVYYIIFNRVTSENLVYLVIGLVIWRFFSSSLVQSTNSINVRMGIIEQVPIKKQLFPLIDLITSTITFLLSCILIFIFIFIFKFPITWHFIEFIPITIIFLIFMYGMGLILAHFGARIADFKLGITYINWLLFFTTPIFYNYNTLSSEIQTSLLLNPATIFIQSYRDCLMFGVSPDYFYLIIFGIIGLILLFIGNNLINNNDKRYVLMK
ncbi:MAG: ABC transporter permease [Methanomassiliicoccales archaeon]|nr:MAG: ABC transporter permease [Methanomassiliicoccales archaeon]